MTLMVSDVQSFKTCITKSERTQGDSVGNGLGAVAGGVRRGREERNIGSGGAKSSSSRSVRNWQDV